MERVNATRWFCNTCSHDWPTGIETAVENGDMDRRGRESTLEAERQRSQRAGERGWGPASSKKDDPCRFYSLDDLIARTGLRRDEVVTLAEIGALNTLGGDRRSALWQAEQAVRPAGELFENLQLGIGNSQFVESNEDQRDDVLSKATHCKFPIVNCELPCPLPPMSEADRLVADYAGTGLTVGRHPMAFRREEMAMRGVLRASDLPNARQGRRVRVAGMVITRQRPGTAKGFTS